MKTAAAYRCLVLLLFTVTLPGLPQAAPGKASPESSSDLGFSIESEMLTYRAMESNSEAVACDIAGYLNRTSPQFTDVPPGAVCVVRSSSPDARVVLLPFGDMSVFIGFQLWREDLAKMAKLQEDVKGPCSQSSSTKGASPAAAAASSALNLTPAAPMINAAQGVLGLLSSEEATSAVKGTVEDQAFLNGVGRQLEALQVHVIMPTVYPPFSLLPLNRKNSPYLASYDQLVKTRQCLNEHGGADSVRAIDSFLATLEGSATAKTNAAGTSAPNKTPEEAAKAPAAAVASDHLHAVLFADGLAQALGLDPTGNSEDQPSEHLLLLKALESGGSVERNSNILGTRIRYSGGFVGTYALFSMAGELECSGNVFEFGGSIKAKHFDTEVDKYQPDPGKQMIFHHGSCRPANLRR